MCRAAPNSSSVAFKGGCFIFQFGIFTCLPFLRYTLEHLAGHWQYCELHQKPFKLLQEKWKQEELRTQGRKALWSEES